MRYLMLFVASIVATAMVACGQRNDSVANANGYPYVYGAGCVAGQPCLNSLMTNRLGGSLDNIGQDALAQMLGQYTGVCANNGWNNYPGQLNYSVTFGSWNCRQYTQAGFLTVQFDSTGSRGIITVGAGNRYSLGGITARFNARTYPINNSTGLLIRGSGQPATGSWSAVYDNSLQITVQSGTLTSPTLTGEVTYRGRHLGDVVLYRY